MNRFLQLLILTGVLFGQDVLLHKSGNFYKGVFIDKVGASILFNIEGDSTYTEFSINDIDIIKTTNSEYYYPFDIPTKMSQSKNTRYKSFNSQILPKNFVTKQEIVEMSDEERSLLYTEHQVSPFGNTLLSYFVPTLGYYRINQWKHRGGPCILLFLGIPTSVGVVGAIGSFFADNEQKFMNKVGASVDSFLYIFYTLYLYDVYKQTKKYNSNLSMSIFDQKEPPSSLGSIFPNSSNYKHYFNFFGFPNHRTGVSIFGYSLTKRTKNNNEFFMGIGTMVINLSINAGWKYYVRKSNADDYYFAISLINNTGEVDHKEDDTKKVSLDFTLGNLSVGYEKRLGKNIFMNIELFTITGNMPNSDGEGDELRTIVSPSFHFNYRF